MTKTLADLGVTGAVPGATAYLAIVTLLGLGLGGLIRYIAGAIMVRLGVVLLTATLGRKMNPNNRMTGFTRKLTCSPAPGAATSLRSASRRTSPAPAVEGAPPGCVLEALSPLLRRASRPCGSQARS